MMPCRQSSCNTGLQPTPRHTPTLRYIPPGLAAGQGTQRGLTQRHTAIAETPKHANTEQHHRGTTTHIPTETQLATETLVMITILPLEIVSDVQAHMIPMQRRGQAHTRPDSKRRTQRHSDRQVSDDVKDNQAVCRVRSQRQGTMQDTINGSRGHEARINQRHPHTRDAGTCSAYSRRQAGTCRL